MKVSLQWISKYVDLSGVSVARIEAALPMIGLEVESVSSAGLPPLEKVVVGEILAFEKHPQADKLSVCRVDVGDGVERRIVCGAKNFKQNDRVPVSLPGAKLPGGVEIKLGNLRGVESQGMMCSAVELGLPAGEDGLLLLTARSPKVGAPINDLFPPADTVFEISVTANRGDALSQLGVARDLAAYFDLPLKSPVPAVVAPAAPAAALARVEDAAFCPLYTAWRVSGVTVAPSPEWLRRDLEAIGLRPINNLVDITNWVMHELGQPLHAFDAAKVAGGELVVRRAAEGETLTLLDGRKLALDSRDGVIADASGPLVLAGVMGGESSGVSDATTDILLESAWFRPGDVRRSSRRFAVSTDSSHRFTRDADPAMVAVAAHRALALIAELAGGRVESVSRLGAAPRADRDIAITGDFVRARLGADTATDADIAAVFRRLGFAVTGTAPGAWRVTVPSFRPEVDRPIDLVEEYVRIKGADFIPVAPVPGPTEPANDAPAVEFVRRAGALLTGRGFAECQHYTLRDGKELEKLFGAPAAAALALANPLAGDQSHVRASLVPGLLDALRLNFANKSDPRRLFEIGRVFRPAKDGLVRELIAVAFAVPAEPASRSWRPAEAPDFFAMKRLALDLAAAAGVTEARLLFAPVGDEDAALWQPGHSARAGDRAGQVVVRCGLVNVRVSKSWDVRGSVYAGEITFASEVFASGPKTARFKPFSSFPPVTKDIALVTDAAKPASEVFDKVKGAAVKAAGKAFEVEGVELFDVYAGAGLPEGKKSLAYGVTFRAADRTLTDDEIAKAMDAVATALEKGAGFAVRR